MKYLQRLMIIVFIGAALMTSVKAKAGDVFPGIQKINHVRQQFRKYAPVKIGIDSSLMDSDEKAVVSELIKATRYVDEIFLRQVWEDNPNLRRKLLRDDNGKLHIIVEYFDLNAGPFDRLDEHKAFVKMVYETQPATAGFYPPDLTKKEWDEWLNENPEMREAFESNYSVIKREGNALEAVPYSEHYSKFLKKAASHLRNASKFARNKSLRKYLNSRAAAFENNDYFQSDVDWMDLKGHTLEIVIGPYEVYEDRFMGYKAAFESYIAMVDKKTTANLERIKTYMGEFEGNLPIDDKYKNTKRGKLSPIVVANLIYSGGDARAGIQTLAFNLPNDEKVREAKGSKKVLLKNVSHAKFNEILIPIARLTIAEKDTANLSFDAFFNHTLLHEISHGIGPGIINIKGEETTVNKALKELYTVIEEAKADTLGLYNNLYLIGKGMYPKESEAQFLSTYLAGLFRSMRFGIAEAHGGGNAIQFNYLLKKKAIKFDKKLGRFSIADDKMKGAIRDLAHELLMIEALGDYAGAKKFVKTYRKLPQKLKAVLAALDAVPVDIRPIYSVKAFKK